MRHFLETVQIVFEIAPKKRFEVFELFLSFMLYNLVSLLPPIATAGIIAVITQGSNFHAIWFYVILFLLFYIIEYTILGWKYYIYVTLSHYYYGTVQQKLFDHIISNISITEKISRGRITDTCKEDVSYLIQTVNSAAIALTGIIQLLIIFLIFASYNIFIALIALIIDLLYIYLMSKNSKNVAKHFDGVRKYQDRILDVLNQILNNLKQIKTLNLMPILNRKISSNRSSYDVQYDKRYLYLTSRYCKIPMIIQVGKITLYIVLAALVFNNQITIDKLVLLISYFEMVVTNTDKTLEELLNLTTFSIRIQRIKSILNYTSYTKNSFGNLNNDYINGDVLFENVSFSISGREILKNISFEAKPNEITAIVGKPGSGKTTIINLLYRLYSIKSGKILIDGRSIFDYTKKVYTTNVSGVFQRPIIFEMSIRDNLSVVDRNQKRQIEACRRVGLFEKIASLPRGLNTVLNEERGIFTDGELQKLAIARALLSQAEILLFDEVTSNVDPETSKEIIKILEDLKDDHTIIIITHKPEIMKIADKIIVLSEGKIVTKGKNKEVLAKSALYRELRSATFARPSLDDESEHIKADSPEDFLQTEEPSLELK